MSSQVSIYCSRPVCKLSCGAHIKNPYLKYSGAHPAQLPQNLFILKGGVAPADAGEEVVLRLLRDLGVKIAEIDLVICATQTPDFNNPGLASTLLKKLSIKGVAGLEIKQGAVSPCYAIDLATNCIKSASAKMVLVVCVDLLSRYFLSDRGSPLGEDELHEAGLVNTAGVLSDGAAVFLVSDNKERLGKQPFEIAGSAFYTGGNNLEGFICRYPSANNFPVRITDKIVSELKHLPKLDIEVMKKGFSKALPPLVERLHIKTGISLQELEYVFCSSYYSSMSEEISSLLDLKSEAFKDCFLEMGFCGAAALMQAFLPLSDELNEQQLIGLLGISSAESVGITVLRSI